MGKQVPENEATRLLISDAEDGRLVDHHSKNALYYESLPLPLVHPVEDDSERSDDEQSLLSRGWTNYNLQLEQWPVLVKSLTAFFVLGLGDAFAQIGQHMVVAGSEGGGGLPPPPSGDWDYLRSLRFGVFGLIGAPWTHYYYHLLDSVLPPTESPWTCTTLLKVFIDQFIQAPIALFFIISGLDLMKGVGVDGTEDDLHIHYRETLVANWKLWLPASVLNMTFVAPMHRVLFVNIVFFLWIVVLSIMLNP